MAGKSDGGSGDDSASFLRPRPDGDPTTNGSFSRPASTPGGSDDITGALYGGSTPASFPGNDAARSAVDGTSLDSGAGQPGFGLSPETIAASEAANEGSFTETRSVSWLDKMSEAAGGVLIGLALVVIMAGLLFWNEGRAVQTYRSLNEGAGLVHGVPPDRVDPANDGKLIHVQGDLRAATPVADRDLGIEASAARLVRTVEMFQWKEDSRTETQKRVGGGEDRVTTYTYTRVWSDRRNESERFHNPNGHANPAMRFARYEAEAGDARLGAFQPGREALKRLPADHVQPVGADTLARLRERIGLGPSSVQDGKLYLGADPNNPRVGDLRVSYHVAPLGPVSFIGRQTGSDIAEFPTRAGDKLLLARAGLVGADAMFATAQAENTALTWFIRILGAILMWVGFGLILRPIAVAGDVIPMLGSVLGAGVSLVAFMLTLVVAPVVIGIAWLFYRPLVGLAILAAAAAAVYGLRLLAQRRTAARLGASGLTPARI